MTHRRDLKAIVRERMAKTGESYVTARAHIVANRATPEASAVRAQGSPREAAATLRAPGIPGWFLAGSAAQDYACAIERDGVDARACAVLRARVASPTGFGTLMQEFSPEAFRARRVRWSAAVKAEGVTAWCGLWMRADGPSERGIAFDNMQSRPVRGTSEWTRYDVVLDVPAESTRLAFGVLLEGPGAVRLRDARLEIVGDDVAVTSLRSRPLAHEPANLDFESLAPRTT